MSFKGNTALHLIANVPGTERTGDYLLALAADTDFTADEVNQMCFNIYRKTYFINMIENKA